MKPFIFIPVGLFLIIWLALGGYAIGLVQTDLKQEANLGDRLYKEGAELAKKRDYKGALVKYEAGLKTAEEIGDKRAALNNLLGIGSIKNAVEDFAKAMEALGKAKQIAEEVDDKRALIKVLYTLGNIQAHQGYYREAKENLGRLLKIYQEAKDKAGMAEALSRLGLVYYFQGDYTQARKFHQQSYGILKELGIEKANELFNIADAYGMQGLYAQAVEYNQRARRMWEEAGDKKGIALTLMNGGFFLGMQGLPEEGLAYLQRALKLWEELGNRDRIAETLNDMAIIHTQQGAYDQAIADSQRALNLWKGLGNRRRIARTLNAIGSVHAMQGYYAQAIPYYEEGLKVSREISAKHDMAEAFNGIGSTYLRIQKYPQAMEALQQALVIGEEIKEPNNIWQARYHLAIGYEKLGQPDLALKYYQSAVEEIERIRAGASSDEGKAGFLQDKIEVYEKLIGLLFTLEERDPKKGHSTKAFHYAERGRARAFLDLLAETKVNVEQGIDAALLGRQREIHARISEIQAQLIKQYSVKSPDREKIKALEGELVKADDDYQTLRQEIRRRHPGYADLQYPEPVQLDAAQRLLSGKTLLLEYFVGEEASFLFAVSKTDYRVARLPRASALHDRVKTLREAIGRPGTDLSSYVKQAQWLYRELIGPASQLLSGKEELIIVADGILHYLPFEVLLKSDGARPAQIDLRTLPYLIRNYAINYVPSASVLEGLLRDRPASHRPQKMLLAYADPVYGKKVPEKTSVASVAVRSAFGEGKPWHLKRLVESRKEVERIAKLYPEEAVTLFLGERASEENVKAEGRLSQYRILHFAVHGLLNENKPQFSGLVLTLPYIKKESKKTSVLMGRAQSSSLLPHAEDGLLQVYEIFNLKLAADLVVLSACETGLGKEVRGEGLMGLTRAFLYAGASSLVVSLWKVADRSTAGLMLRFYQHLKSEGISKAEALRRAQLELIDQRTLAHPYYWAPFVLVGKP